MGHGCFRAQVQRYKGSHGGGGAEEGQQLGVLWRAGCPSKGVQATASGVTGRDITGSFPGAQVTVSGPLMTLSGSLIKSARTERSKVTAGPQVPFSQRPLISALAPAVQCQGLRWPSQAVAMPRLHRFPHSVWKAAL